MACLRGTDFFEDVVMGLLAEREVPEKAEQPWVADPDSYLKK